MQSFINTRLSVFEGSLLQGLKKNKGNFTAEVMEAYKYVFSQPWALTAAFNYFRCIFKPRKMEKSTQKIEVPILIIWVKWQPISMTTITDSLMLFLG